MNRDSLKKKQGRRERGRGEKEEEREEKRSEGRGSRTTSFFLAPSLWTPEQSSLESCSGPQVCKASGMALVQAWPSV